MEEKEVMNPFRERWYQARQKIDGYLFMHYKRNRLMVRSNILSSLRLGFVTKISGGMVGVGDLAVHVQLPRGTLKVAGTRCRKHGVECRGLVVTDQISGFTGADDSFLSKRP